MSNTAKNCRWITGPGTYCEAPVKYVMVEDGGEPGAPKVRSYKMFCPEHEAEMERRAVEFEDSEDSKPLVTETVEQWGPDPVVVTREYDASVAQAREEAIRKQHAEWQKKDAAEHAAAERAARPLFASWTSQAHYDAREQGLHHELEQAMELIGDIADKNWHYGPLEDKLRLLEALLKRHVKDDVVFRVMGDTRRISQCGEYADHGASIQVLAMVLGCAQRAGA